MTSSHQDPLLQQLDSRLDQASLDFETGVLEQLVERDPDNLEYLAALGQNYSRLRRYQRGLEVDRQLVARQPGNAHYRYNLACSLALTGDLNGACGELLRSIDLGYRDFEHLLLDEDLASLRDDRRFGLIADRIAEIEETEDLEGLQER